MFVIHTTLNISEDRSINLSIYLSFYVYIYIYIYIYIYLNNDSPSGIFGDFFRAALFSEKLLLCTSLITLTQQLLLRSIYFFRAAAFFKELRFRKSHFSAAVIFSEYLIFRNETSTEQPLCENRKFFSEQLFFWWSNCLE